MREGWNKQLSLALPLGFLHQEQVRTTDRNGNPACRRRSRISWLDRTCLNDRFEIRRK